MPTWRGVFTSSPEPALAGLGRIDEREPVPEPGRPLRRKLPGRSRLGDMLLPKSGKQQVINDPYLPGLERVMEGCFHLLKIGRAHELRQLRHSGESVGVQQFLKPMVMLQA